MPTLLVVEDTKFMRNLYREILADTPFDIVAAVENGVEGVDAYRDHDPDEVIMNVRMPILDGIGATEQIREYDPDATVVICTGNKQEAKMRAAVEAGATDYVTKPFQREGLIAALRDAVE